MDDEVEELRLRVQSLEDILGQNDQYLTVFRLPPSMSNLMGLLMAVPTVTPIMMRRHLKISTEPKVTILRLRKHLRDWDIKINCHRNTGYWITDADKALIRAGTVAKI